MGGTSLVDLVDRIYGSVLEPANWPALITDVARAVGGVGGILLPITPMGTAIIVTSPDLAEASADYERLWWQQDSRSRAGWQRRARGIVTDLDLFSDDDMRRDPFFQDFLRPHGLGLCAAHISEFTPGQVTSLSIQRSLKKRAFEKRELEALAFLGRHTARSLTATTKIAQQGRITSAMSTMVERIACGVILLDSRGIVTFVNELARALLGDGLTIRQRRIWCGRPDSQRDLDRLVAEALPASGSSPGASIAIPRVRGLPILVQAIPIGPSTADRLEQVVLGPGGVLLLLQDVVSSAGSAGLRHLAELGLTPGQARIAEAVGRGRSPREAAAALGLSERTVRHVLKTVYGKLGISRQSELALILAKLEQVG